MATDTMTRPKSAAAPSPRPEVRQAVRDLLTRSKAFGELPADTQRQIARDTALIADYLAAPEGVVGNGLAGGVGGQVPLPAPAVDGAPASIAQASFEEATAEVDKIGQGKFDAGAAREGAAVAGEFMQAVNFTSFVTGLVNGVFDTIIESSIKQMEAYGSMVASVAQSLQQFRDENVTENQGRDHLVEKFPDTFEIGLDEFADTPEPRLRLKEGVDEAAALQTVRSSIRLEDGELTSLDVSDANVEQALVIAARNQLARQRQQLLASLVLMGINRIVVTGGSIQAKVMYDFRAKDARQLARSATASDYARNRFGGLEKMNTSTSEWDRGREVSDAAESQDRGGKYYSKGTYKFSQQPVMTAMSVAREASTAELETRASMTGSVSVNFKSDYLPLEKMATPGMIAAIQGNSRPVDPNVVPSMKTAPAAAPGGGGAPPSPAATP
jgi:hypothetical protein